MCIVISYNWCFLFRLYIVGVYLCIASVYLRIPECIFIHYKCIVTHSRVYIYTLQVYIYAFASVYLCIPSVYSRIRECIFMHCKCIFTHSRVYIYVFASVYLQVYLYTTGVNLHLFGVNIEGKQLVYIYTCKCVHIHPFWCFYRGRNLHFFWCFHNTRRFRVYINDHKICIYIHQFKNLCDNWQRVMHILCLSLMMYLLRVKHLPSVQIID